MIFLSTEIAKGAPFYQFDGVLGAGLKATHPRTVVQIPDAYAFVLYLG